MAGWGREMRAGLAFVLISLLAGSAFREWRRSHEGRFEDLVERLEARREFDSERAADSASARLGPAPESSRSGLPRRRSSPLGIPLKGLDPDHATRAQLMELPGIGPALASRIVADREARGPFRVPEALLRVPGIGPRTLERIRPYLSSETGAEPESLARD